jgi:hypothetical protein
VKKVYKSKIFVKKIFLISIITTAFLLTPAKVYAALSFTELGSVVDSDAINDDSFGYVLKIGNFNGDGYQDLIVTERGPTSDFYIFYGGLTLDINPNVIIERETDGDAFSTSEFNFGLGDIDKDGYDDIVGSAWLRDQYGINAGKGYLFFGSVSPLSNIPASSAPVIFPGNTTTKYPLGYVSLMGDFNGDRNQDVVITAHWVNSNAGAIHIYYGNGTKNFDNNEDKTLSVASSYMFGLGYLDVGDINNDGFDDLLTGEFHIDQGEMYLFYGGQNMLTTYTPSNGNIKFNAENSTDGLSRGAAIGDLDSDGYDDICLGAHRNDTYTTNSGRTYCFFGSTNLSGNKAVGTDADFIINGLASNDNLGRDMDIYDVNNDGHMDLIIGAYQTDGSDDGYVNVYLSNGTKNFDTIADVTINAPLPDDLFGFQLVGGDLNNNGWIELFIASALGGNPSNDGRVYIFEVNHGSPSVTPNDIGTTDDPTPIFTGVARDPDIPLAGVQWSFGSDPAGEWYDCGAEDGSFDSEEETFLCDLALAGGELEGEYTIYIRTFDENGLYMPPVLFGTSTFTVELPETGSELMLYYIVGLMFIVYFGVNKWREGRKVQYIVDSEIVSARGGSAYGGK